MRLDHYLTQKTKISRHQVQKRIEGGFVKVQGKVVTKPAFSVKGTEAIDFSLPLPEKEITLKPQDIPLDILYEDKEIVVVNKPAGMVVHPGAGNSSHTLVNALLARYSDLPEGSDPLKPGIVHRLDKGTSGCLVVAKTKEALNELQRQFKSREVQKIYLALLIGRLEKEGRIDKPLGRHPKKRHKISSISRKKREASTEWRVLESFDCARSLRQRRISLVRIQIHTGRTHQIRVHFAEAGSPVLGDPLYGGQNSFYKDWIGHPALHALKLSLLHPKTKAGMEFEAPLPQDFNLLLQKLREGKIGEIRSGK